MHFEETKLRYQIFVSSTYSDLSAERELVIHELTKAGFIAVGMEQFPATDEEQMEYIKPLIDESDYHVVISRGKYGSEGADGISFTEKECHYAASTGKPVLGFLFKNSGSLRMDETDQDPEKMKKLDAFRKSLESKKIVRYWNDKNELVSAVKDTIHDQVRRKPGVGWVRGDQAIDPKVYKELEEARQENARLLDLLAKSDSELVTFPPHLRSGSDKVGIDYKIDNTEHHFETSWDDVFDILTEYIHMELSERDSTRGLVLTVAQRAGHNHNHSNIRFTDELSRLIRYQFVALGLIETFVKQEESSGPSGMYHLEKFCWRFTAKGRRYASERNALTRGDYLASQPISS